MTYYYVFMGLLAVGLIIWTAAAFRDESAPGNVDE